MKGKIKGKGKRGEGGYEKKGGSRARGILGRYEME
jgi:hypothetical protein